MKLLNGRILGLAAAVALFLGVGALASALPASANGPRNQFHYPHVMGVDGSSQSSVDMGLSTDQRFQVIMEKVPWIAATDEAGIASWRYEYHPPRLRSGERPVLQEQVGERRLHGDRGRPIRR